MPEYLVSPAGALIGPVVFPVVPGLGVQLPANAVELPSELSPPEKGFAWAWVDGAPQLLPDYRGQVFQIHSGAASTWERLGNLPEGLTTQPRPDPYHVWLDDRWQLDREARESATLEQLLLERDNRLREAATRLAPLQYAVDLGEASTEEKNALLDWKRYCIALNRIEQQPGYPSEIEWPVLAPSALKAPSNPLFALFRGKNK